MAAAGAAAAEMAIAAGMAAGYEAGVGQAAAGAGGEHPLERRLSTRSQHAMASLEQYETQFHDIVKQVRAMEGGVEAQGVAAGREALCKAKSKVSQLTVTLDKLQLEGVDRVVVGELESGQAEARAARKELTVSIEQLVPRLMTLDERLTADIQRCPL